MPVNITLASIAFFLALLAGMPPALPAQSTASYGAPQTNASPSSSANSPFAHYGGSKSCADCHQTEYRAWQTSHHALAERPPGLASDQKAFAPARAFNQGVEHTSVRLDGTNFLVTCIGRSNTNETFVADRVIGENPLRQFLVAFPGGRFQTLEATYDPRSNDWFDVFGGENRQPGEWGHWTGRGMTWNTMCAACHNTRLEKNYNEATDTYQTTMAERSVGCEACHGPMQSHADWQNQFGKSGKPDPTLAKFSRQQFMDDCAYCHSRRSELTGDFKPGDDFFNHASLQIVDGTDTFHPDGQIHDEDYEYTAFCGSRMQAAGVYCLDCHNPHTGKTVLPGNLLCLRCHNGSNPKAPKIDPLAHSHHRVFGYGTNQVFNASPAAYAHYDASTIQETGGECVNCHMPQTVYMQRHWRHDHGFTSPDPLLTQQFGIPNACNRCHADKTADWALAVTEKWYGDKMERPARARAQTLAKARAGDPAARPLLLNLLTGSESSYWKAVATGFLGQWADEPTVKTALLKELQAAGPLEREQAARSLEPFAEQNDASVVPALTNLLGDPRLNVRLAAAWSLRSTIASNSPTALELQHYLANNADQPPGQAQIGAWLLAQGRLDDAAAHYAKAVAWDDHSAPFHHDLAIVLSMQGKGREAVEQLETACRLDPEDADYEFKLGLGWAELNELDHAAAAMEKAVTLNPQLPRAWYNLGLIYQSLGRGDKALDALQHAENLTPADPEIPSARAAILVRLGRLGDARLAANKAIGIDHNCASAQKILEFIANH